MIDARMAANMLLMLEPKIVEAKAVLEAATELQAIIAVASLPAPEVAPKPEPSDGNDDHKEPAAIIAAGG